MSNTKVHAHQASHSAVMFCGQSPSRNSNRAGITSENPAAVTCTRCLAKLAARKAPKAPRVVEVEVLTAEEQAHLDSLPVIPRMPYRR